MRAGPILALCLTLLAGCAGTPAAVSIRPPASATGVPGPLIETYNYAFVPDEHSVWHGPQTAAGVLIWSHGKGGFGIDERGVPPQAFTKLFNDAGFDIVRFERAPLADDRERASGWLHDGAAALRRAGYRVVIAAGQSRGAWNSLELLDTPGLADVVIAVSPAAHGSGGSVNLNAQTDDFRAMLSATQQQSTRVAMVQFRNDLFMGDGDERRRLMERLVKPKVGALLLIDRPDGFRGHTAGAAPGFAPRFGPCLLRFATAPQPSSDPAQLDCGTAHQGE